MSVEEIIYIFHRNHQVNNDFDIQISITQYIIYMYIYPMYCKISAYYFTTVANILAFSVLQVTLSCCLLNINFLQDLLFIFQPSIMKEAEGLELLSQKQF